MARIFPWAVELAVGQRENGLDLLQLEKDSALDLEGGKFESSGAGTTTFVVTRMDGGIVQHSLAPGERYTDHGRHVVLTVTRTILTSSDIVTGSVVIRDPPA
jgi:hypothetical protein